MSGWTMPEIGDIWVDRRGDYNLIVDVYNADIPDNNGDGTYVHVLCLNDGEHFSENGLDHFGEGEFFLRRVG